MRLRLVRAACSGEAEPVRQRREMCRFCSLAPLCLPLGLDSEQLPAGENLIVRRKLKRRSFLYRMGDEFHSLYAVKSGSVKSLSVARNGECHITGFAVGGDLLGLDGIAAGAHSQEVVALEEAWVCQLRYARLRQAAEALPDLLHHFHVLLSEQVLKEQELAALLRRVAVEQRLAAFLSTLAKHRARRGLAITPLPLPMQRRDIANHLGMTAESVSRALARLRQSGQIRIARKTIEPLIPHGAGVGREADHPHLHGCVEQLVR